MFSTPDNPQAPTPSLAEIVREETEDGRLIVRFLIDVMQGLLEESKPCHRLDAARQLLNLGFHSAQTFLNANTTAAQKRLPSTPAAAVPAPSPLHQDLAALIREETDNGRTTVRFLIDVMEGLIPDFKPHHRISAAKELLTRGFDAPTPDNVASPIVASPIVASPIVTSPIVASPIVASPIVASPIVASPIVASPIVASPIVASPVAVSNAAASTPAESPAEPESPQIRVIPGHGNRYQAAEHGPFYFETYDEADYNRDCDGEYALKHVLGCEESTTAATLAVMDLRREGLKAAIASGQDQKQADHLGTVPNDAPQPKDIYGYPVLLHIYGSEPAARVAAKGAADYYRELARKSANPDPSGRPEIPVYSLYGPRDTPRLPPPEPAAPKPAPPKPSIQMPGVYMEPRPIDPDDPDDPDYWSDYRPRITFDRFTAPIIP